MEPVFFATAGDEDGWTKLARNLNAETDTNLIQAYRCTVSFPVEPGERRRTTAKIIHDLGIEDLKVEELEIE